jgi:hypothetical protein
MFSLIEKLFVTHSRRFKKFLPRNEAQCSHFECLKMFKINDSIIRAQMSTCDISRLTIREGRKLLLHKLQLPAQQTKLLTNIFNSFGSFYSRPKVLCSNS